MIKISKPPNLTELAYLSVKQSLVDGSLGEGQRLTEESLSTQLGISKSPIREALTRLESEGLLNIEARRGAYVRRFNSKDVSDLYDLRELLEVHAVGLAVITPAFLGALAESIEHTRKHLDAGDRMAHVEEDIRFHNLIAAATGNEELRRVLENMNHKSLLCRSKTFNLSSTMAPVSHSRIYLALKDGERVLAQQAMKDHIQYVRNSLLRSLKATEPLTIYEEDAGLALSTNRS
ncbi:GntR family transcriptional regulator [Granulicella mallensis]|uniref:Transcriptional regulator, GntR family n=1 Tax=Granulicella mallensis (strain ATCC BAA-1857 / DSM 23137 / MP5ACTX8) TaxID=682795 RepID=G8NY79_GRAMM|nr:GntR family transcriptional regulator [Granulicella mallensis]AEU36753.1 transcriptional regulator, GntR family [Granulicella mallensis MP5ACTX8]